MNTPQRLFDTEHKVLGVTSNNSTSVQYMYQRCIGNILSTLVHDDAIHDLKVAELVHTVAILTISAQGLKRSNHTNKAITNASPLSLATRVLEYREIAGGRWREVAAIFACVRIASEVLACRRVNDIPTRRAFVTTL